jgi:hypothetical protein
MFLRCKVRRKDGKQHRYWSVVENTTQIGSRTRSRIRLRGPQHDAAWCDELAAWRYPEAWDMLMFGMRLGADPRTVVTTTPRPAKYDPDGRLIYAGRVLPHRRMFPHRRPVFPLPH